jgi:hypothetical protein
MYEELVLDVRDSFSYVALETRLPVISNSHHKR